jgi:hypothetical protein
MSGVLFVILGVVGIVFFSGIEWFGIDELIFMAPWLGVALIGLLLLTARGLWVMLPAAAVIGFTSAIVWMLAWGLAEGFDWLAAPVAVSLLGAIVALRGWAISRGGSPIG